MSEELKREVAELKARLDKLQGTGLGCPPAGGGGGGHSGTSCPDGFDPQRAELVYKLLQAGSSKLAYSVAYGYPLVPYFYTLTAMFQTGQTAVVPNVGQDQKIVQDTIIDMVSMQVQNQNTPAGVDSNTNYYYELESGIEADMLIVGAAGGYQPQAFYQPIKTFCGKKDMWLLTYNNAIVMNFNPTVPPPFNVKVSMVFEGRTSYWRRLLDMTSMEAICKVKQMGFVCDSYEQAFQS